MKELVITGILAVLASSGLWAFLSSIVQTHSDKHKEALESIAHDLKDIREELNRNSKVTIAEARTTINTRCKKYRRLGYIPDDEYIAFKMIGEAYVEANENTPVKMDFEWCIANLERVEETE